MNYSGRIAVLASLVVAGAIGLAQSAAAAEACTPGKTHKIAFMLKQQTAFRYLTSLCPLPLPLAATKSSGSWARAVRSASTSPMTRFSTATSPSP